MLYHLFYELLSADISGLNVFRYLTFRSVGAALTALLIAFIAGPWLIRELGDRQIGQTIRDDTPDRHHVHRLLGTHRAGPRPAWVSAPNHPCPSVPQAYVPRDRSNARGSNP